jgi:hypothetical protein
VRVKNVGELAEKLTEHTWTLCQGFELLGYLFLNDALSEDGAQEYGIVKKDSERFFQVESVTFDWCSPERAIQLIDDTIHGEFDDGPMHEELSLSDKLDNPETHGRCEFCV